MREELRRWPLWVDLRRWQKEGFSRAWKRWRIYSAILDSPPVRTGCRDADTEVHLLCYRNDYLGAIWTLKTFYYFAKIRWPVVIHVQGRETPRMMKRLKRHFPDARVILQAEADRIVVPMLKKRKLTRLLEARAANHYILKLTDFILLADAPKLLTLDSDVLFFSHPQALLADTAAHVFQRDPESTYVLDAATARSMLNVELAPRINVGMMRFHRDHFSLEKCDRYLKVFPTLNGWLEQTVYALHASEMGNAQYLPEDYLISLATGVDYSKLTARHYAGPSRALLHEEGIPFLLRERPGIRNRQPPETRSALPNLPD